MTDRASGTTSASSSELGAASEVARLYNAVDKRTAAWLAKQARGGEAEKTSHRDKSPLCAPLTPCEKTRW